MARLFGFPGGLALSISVFGRTGSFIGFFHPMFRSHVIADLRDRIRQREFLPVALIVRLFGPVANRAVRDAIKPIAFPFEQSANGVAGK